MHPPPSGPVPAGPPAPPVRRLPVPPTDLRHRPRPGEGCESAGGGSRCRSRCCSSPTRCCCSLVAWSSLHRVDALSAGGPGADAGSHLPRGRQRLAGGPDRRAAPRAAHRPGRGAADRHDHAAARPGRRRPDRAGQRAPRLLRLHPRATARTRSTRRTRSAGRNCWCAPWSRRPGCTSTATSRPGSAATRSWSTPSAASTCA